MNSKICTAVVLSLSLILVLQIVFLPFFLSLLFVVKIICFWWVSKRKLVLAKACTFLLVGFALIAIYLGYQSFIGVEAGVALLSTFLFAKALESKNKRDLIILFNFALFVSASLFLHSQSIWMAVGVICSLIMCLMGLYRIQIVEFNADERKKTLQQDIQHVSTFLLYAVPFFILLFMFFPRLPPLWHIPIPENKGVTGISDTMSPGDIASLSQSTALAFRIIGDMQQLPSRSELYWRALVLDEYDGQKWSSSFFNQQPLQFNEGDSQRLNQVWEYRYLAADPSVMWIMSLEKSIAAEPRYYNRQDWGIVPRRLTQRIEPIQLHWLKQNIEGKFEHPEFLYRMNTKVQIAYDPQAQALAERLYQESSHDPERYIQRVLDWYRTNNFVYTLTPGLLGQNRIDDFLFQSRQGFCEHYASSFVMLMRYVGIPARVVVGYQGGQMAPDFKSWEVRQLDAHAWTEVLIDGRWQRYDPTAIIAPQRIDEGMQNILSQDDRIFGEQTAFAKQSFHLMNKIRVWSDYAGYQWQSKVVGYNAEAQRTWLSKLGIHSSYSAILILILTILGCLALYFIVLYWLKYRKRSPLSRLIGNFNSRLDLPLKRAEYESVQQWMLRISEDLPLNEHAQFKEIAALYDRYMYAGQQTSVQELKYMSGLLDSCANVLKKPTRHLF